MQFGLNGFLFTVNLFTVKSVSLKVLPFSKIPRGGAMAPMGH